MEYELATGRSAMDMTPGQLLFRIKLLEQRQKAETQRMAAAVAVALSGSKEAWKALE
ncbi:hypothetical protein [Rhizobium leguminosarum]|uniref:hypothetical protein n=1 Tax=Rhizobium leguminosarum TaxID=384 RepID=UPI0014420E95|nr:hypothetical protein [Rhizobium leguminosarum]MBY5873720.1 hypothetical protein [Rhizobium leguminosarum]